MKKSVILILTVIMAIAFFGLLYQQVEYIIEIRKMRINQFDEAVKRSLYDVSRQLELEQSKKFVLANIHNYLALKSNTKGLAIDTLGVYKQLLSNEGGNGELNTIDKSMFDKPFNTNSRKGNAITRASSDMQDEWVKRYVKERDLLDIVVAKLLEVPSTLPVTERINMRLLDTDLKSEFRQNVIELPFSFEVVDRNNIPLYRQPKFIETSQTSVYSQMLFSNDPIDKHVWLKVNFPTKDTYIYQEVLFLWPAVFFTVILLITFIIIITITLRHKKLSEMKSDFMNNMTHELKTPVSTISLAAQMLKDGAVMKSPAMFKHISGVINDETERLSFQVEKVLQMSLFEKQKATLKMKPIEMNDIIITVANTFQLKVEKFGGELDVDLEATDSLVKVDKMHITNVIFNLLDNAVKYRREDTPLKLMIRTRNNNNNKLVISIEDNGIGIKKDDVKKIFERFFRVSTGNKHDVKGFGLGLAYVYKIISDHKGTIKVESEINNGSKFIITLPLIN